MSERERLNDAVAAEIRRGNDELIASGSLSFACPYCGDWLPTPKAYQLGFAFNDSHQCSCGRTSTSKAAALEGLDQ